MANETKTWTIETVRELLNKSNFAVERAILALYARQEEDEKATESTSHSNGKGFGAFDAEFFSSLATQILASKNPNGYRLSPGQLNACRRSRKEGGVSRIGRYAGQLLRVIQQSQEAERAALKEAA